MRYLPLALAGLLVASTAAVAQAPPPGAPGLATPPAGAAPPPPPPGPDAPPPPGPGAGPPPPPSGADIRFDRGPGTDLHLRVHCAEADPTKACADIANQLIDKLNLAVQAK